jgi:hypothetical protein
MKYLTSVLILATAFAITTAQPCRFVPHESLKCLEFLSLHDRTHGCSNTTEHLEFTGVITTIDGIGFIGVKPIHEQSPVRTSFFLTNIKNVYI